MNSNNLRFIWAVCMVLALTILPLPEWLNLFRPSVALLLILYVQFYIPKYFTVPFLFVMGLCLDALLASIIGEHVFALLLTTWISSILARRFNFFPIGQQMLLILVFSFIYQFALEFTNAFLGYNYNLFAVAGTAMVSMLVWPWARLLGDATLLNHRRKI